jgi:hypothetical protein
VKNQSTATPQHIPRLLNLFQLWEILPGWKNIRRFWIESPINLGEILLEISENALMGLRNPPGVQQSFAAHENENPPNPTLFCNKVNLGGIWCFAIRQIPKSSIFEIIESPVLLKDMREKQNPGLGWGGGDFVQTKT